MTPPSNNPVELLPTVARAICDELEAQDLHVMGDGDDYIVIYQTPRICLSDLARAAIEACGIQSLTDEIRLLCEKGTAMLEAFDGHCFVHDERDELERAIARVTALTSQSGRVG